MAQLNISAIVVLYNSALFSSETINTLFSTKRENINLTVVIWNNGPTELSPDEAQRYLNKCREHSISSAIYQDCRNISLSKIYNFFIDNYAESDYFSILDQDTLLSQDFFTNIYNNMDYHVVLPVIHTPDDSESIKSPSYFNHKPFQHGEFNLGDCYAIGSCLSFSSHLVSLIRSDNMTCFDERYAFYRVDTEFFVTIKKHNHLKGICIGNIIHHLSEKKDPSKMCEFKKLENGYDRLLSRIHNRNKPLLKNIFYCFKLKKEYHISTHGFIALIKCIISKKHPKTEIFIGNNKKPDYYFKNR